MKIKAPFKVDIIPACLYRDKPEVFVVEVSCLELNDYNLDCCFLVPLQEKRETDEPNQQELQSSGLRRSDT